MKFPQILWLLTIVATLFACDNDVDIADDYVETIVVYGMLDHRQDTQFIKVNKAFLGEGNAIQYARVSDSSQFSDLAVKLVNEQDGSEINLQSAVFPKDPGVFATDNNIIYFTTDRLIRNRRYRLEIVNNENGNTARSATTTIDTIRVQAPGATLDVTQNPPVVVRRPISLVNNIREIQSYNFRFETGKNLGLFRADMYFNFKQVIGSDTTDVSLKFPLAEFRNINGGERLLREFDYEGNLFFDDLVSKLTADPSIIRIFDDVVVRVIGGDENLNFYMDVNGPLDGLAQVRPEFTNIENGVGIFGSRYTLDIETDFDTPTKDAIINNQRTAQLNFRFP